MFDRVVNTLPRFGRLVIVSKILFQMNKRCQNCKKLTHIFFRKRNVLSYLFEKAADFKDLRALIMSFISYFQ